MVGPFYRYYECELKFILIRALISVCRGYHFTVNVFLDVALLTLQIYQ